MPLWTDVEIFNFFESHGKRGLRVGIALVLILVGLIGFIWQIDDVAAYEQSCWEPIVVEAVIHVEQYNSGSYDKYVSYTYEGIRYERVFLYYTRSPFAMDDDGETITVTLDPRNPGRLARHMVNETTINIPLIVLVLGCAMLCYCACLENQKLRDWLVGLTSGKERKMELPDYLVDLTFLAMLILLPIGAALWIAFPLAVGGTYVIAAGLGLAFGVVLRYSVWRYQWRNK